MSRTGKTGWLALALVVSWACTPDDDDSGGDPNALVLEVLTGSPQSSFSRNQFNEPLTVRVKRASNSAPVPGVKVVFASPEDEPTAYWGSKKETSGISNGMGLVAVEPPRAGDLPGKYTIIARTVTGGEASVGLPVSNYVSAPGITLFTGGLTQIVAPQTETASGFFVRALDELGVPHANAQVTFTTTGSYGAECLFPGGVNTFSVSTDADGKTSAPPCTAGEKAAYVTIAVSGPEIANVSTTVWVRPPEPWLLDVVEGHQQEARLGLSLVTPIKVRVTDARGMGYPGAELEFNAPDHGPTCMSADGMEWELVTDAEGYATTNCYPTGNVGDYVLTVFMHDSSLILRIPLTNVPGLPYALKAGFPLAMDVGAGQALPELRVTVQDRWGFGVAGSKVRYAATGGGCLFESNASVEVTADDGGLARPPACTAGLAPGQYPLDVTLVDNASLKLNATFTVQPTQPYDLRMEANGTQTRGPGTAFAPMDAKVVDANGFPLAGIPVTFQAPSAGPRCVFQGGLLESAATTNASGVASSGVCTALFETGSFSINVTSPATTEVTSAQLTIAYQAPGLTRMEGTSATYGDTINVHGTNLTGASAVTLDDVSVISFNVLSDDLISVRLGCGSAGRLSVQTPGGSATLVIPYVVPQPAVGGVSPNSGPRGTRFTVSGTRMECITSLAVVDTSPHVVPSEAVDGGWAFTATPQQDLAYDPGAYRVGYQMLGNVHATDAGFTISP